jgi:hypothetical protein
MSTVTTTSIAVAPSPAPRGHSDKGAHVLAWRGQKAFDPTSTIRLLNPSVNPWRAVESADFYSKVLCNPDVTTVQQAIDLAIKLRICKSAARVQGHLRWLYTWGPGWLEVNGQLYGQSAAPVEAPAKKSGKAKKSA